MEKSGAKSNDQLSRKLEPQEVDSLVQTPRRSDQAAGDRLRVYRQRFEDLSNEIQITKACEFAGCMLRVSIGMHCKTIHDVDDGLKVRQEHAENIHYLVKIAKSLHGSVVQFFKSKLHVVLIITKSKYRYCKYHTSNDVFSRCKKVHKMATGRSDDELIQSDNKMRIGTRSGKFIIVD